MNAKNFRYLQLGFTLVALMACLPGSALATGMTYNLDARGDAYDQAFNPNATSYDGPAFNAFSAFAGAVDPAFQQLQGFSITGGAEVSAQMLTENGFYDGNHASVGNSFGYVDSNNEFVSFFSKDSNPGDETTLTLGDGNYNFALNSPEGIFYDDDLKNAYDGFDARTHMLALRVVKDTTITIPNANLFGLTITVTLNANDLLIFTEDLKFTCSNALNGGICGDNDYNDAVFRIRATEVPEPGTMLLLGSGLVGFAGLRRRKAA